MKTVISLPGHKETDIYFRMWKNNHGVIFYFKLCKDTLFL